MPATFLTSFVRRMIPTWAGLGVGAAERFRETSCGERIVAHTDATLPPRGTIQRRNRMEDDNQARVRFEGSQPILRVEAMEASLRFYVDYWVLITPVGAVRDL